MNQIKDKTSKIYMIRFLQQNLTARKNNQRQTREMTMNQQNNLLENCKRLN